MPTLNNPRPLSLDEVERHVAFTAKMRARMAERGVSYDEIEDALTRPQITEVSYHNGRRGFRYVRGHLVVVMTPDMTLVTLLLRRVAVWTDDDMRGRQR